MSLYRKSGAVASGLLALVATAVSAGGASADSIVDEPIAGIVGNYTGGDVSDPVDGQVTSSQAQEKVALTLAWDQVLSGQLSQATYMAREAVFLEKYGLDSRSNSSTTSSLAEAAAATSRTLPLTHYGQSKDYYCGPASGLMVVKMADGSITSRYNGNPFSQANMANSSHMNTESVGATRWSSARFTTGVNRWRGENWYVQVHAPSGSLLESVMRSSIGNNAMPVAGDTVEIASGRHYNGHPVSQTIGHWITAYGYSGSGATSAWADPSTTVWSGVSKTFSYDTSNFSGYFLQSNGIAY